MDINTLFIISSAKRACYNSSRRRWEDNIKMDFREVGWGGMDCIDRDQWRASVNTVINIQVSWNVEKFLSDWAATGGFSGRPQLHGVSKTL
jgi:hypothetical protein